MRSCNVISSDCHTTDHTHRSAAQNYARIPGPEPERLFGNLRNTELTSG